MQQTSTSRDLQDLICAALAEVVPPTAEEVAEAIGLDPASVEAELEQLAVRRRVMFNPLTKRFSLPKDGSSAAWLPEVHPAACPDVPPGQRPGQAVATTQDQGLGASNSARGRAR